MKSALFSLFILSALSALAQEPKASDALLDCRLTEITRSQSGVTSSTPADDKIVTVNSNGVLESAQQICRVTPVNEGEGIVTQISIEKKSDSTVISHAEGVVVSGMVGLSALASEAKCTCYLAK